MAKKHSFHCQTCGEECTIYKKGKGHRVLVCPKCGVLATNPIKLGGIVGKAFKVAKFVPALSTAANILEESGIVSTAKQSPAPRVANGAYRHRLNALDWAEKALSAR
jgi:hypothetical protein